MRGTVYVIADDGEGHRTITRRVHELDVESAVRFEEVIRRNLPTGARAEFGPIGEPWS